jgi:hypothetical protein
MSLKSKAKEVREYWQNPHNEWIKGKGWNQLVVTLEDAQKLEAENQQLKTDNEQLLKVFNNAAEVIIQSSSIIGNNRIFLRHHLQKEYDFTQPSRRTESEDKIVEANKILDTKQICRNCISFTDCNNCPLEHLKEVLKSE